MSFKTCPWVQRAAIVLREKKVEFDFPHIDRDNRPAWFLAISPHKKVPVLQIDGKVSLFESNAIAEYLDETSSRGCIRRTRSQRAINRAWTDYVPTFAEHVTGLAYADDEAEPRSASTISRWRSSGLTRAGEAGRGAVLQRRESSLVDAAYAPFLQRYYFLDRIRPLGMIEKYPHLRRGATRCWPRPR